MKDEITKKVLQGQLSGGLYKVTPTGAPLSSSSSVNIPVVFVSTLQDMSLWYHRLGHPYESILKSILRLCNVNVQSSSMSFCNACCQMAKSRRLPFSLSQSTSTKPFELVYSNIWGPSLVLAINGARYFLLFVHDFTKYT